MKRKFLIALFALLLGAVLAFWFGRWRAAQPKPDVAIQDGKTIDFSSGRPVVKDDSAEQKIINHAVAEMDAAAKDVTFAPTAPPPSPAEKEPEKPAPPPAR